jgi:hypothetical protein
VPLIGLTLDGKKIVSMVVKGPSSYAAGGWTVYVPELSKIHAVSVSVRTNLKANNYVHAVDYRYSNNAITFVAYRIDVTATSPAAWSEVPTGTDLSALEIEVVAVGV